MDGSWTDHLLNGPIPSPKMVGAITMHVKSFAGFDYGDVRRALLVCFAGLFVGVDVFVIG
jgi:hypothetical protein